MSASEYFRRKSENLSTAIEAVYGLRVDDETDKSLKLASQAFSEMLSFDLEKILKMEPESFIDEIKKLNYSTNFNETLVRLILETAEIYNLLKKEREVINLKTKAFYLLNYINLDDKTWSEERERQLTELEKMKDK